MRHSPKGSNPKPEESKHALVQKITSQRVKVQNLKGQSGQSPNSLSPKTDSPKQDAVQKVGAKKAIGPCPDRPKSDEAKIKVHLELANTYLFRTFENLKNMLQGSEYCRSFSTIFFNVHIIEIKTSS